VRRLPAATGAVLVCLLALSGCGWFGSSAPKQTEACPSTVILRPLANTAVFGPAPERRPDNVSFYGLLSEADAKCVYSGHSLTGCRSRSPPGSPRSDLAVRQGRGDRLHRRGDIRRTLDRRQGEFDRALAAGCQNALEAEPHCSQVALERQLDGSARQRLGFAGQQYRRNVVVRPVA